MGVSVKAKMSKRVISKRLLFCAVLCEHLFYVRDVMRNRIHYYAGILGSVLDKMVVRPAGPRKTFGFDL